MSSSLVISEYQRYKDLQWRVERLEKLFGSSGTKTFNDLIQDLDEKLIQRASHHHPAQLLISKADQIQQLTNAEFQRYLLSDRQTKLEMILADERRIREMTMILVEINRLASVLDEETLEKIPNFFGTLNKFSSIHQEFRVEFNDFGEDLRNFLENYATFTLAMDKNLHEYKKCVHRICQVEDQETEMDE